jgi:ammonia channel protein AmtB
MRSRLAKIALLFVLLLAVADITHSLLSRAISARDIRSMHDFNAGIVLHLLAYLLTFGLAGALIARAATPRMRMPLAVSIGLTAQLLLLIVHEPRPWLAQSHGSTFWFDVLAWSNLYMSTLSSATGGLVWIAIESRFARRL